MGGLNVLGSDGLPGVSRGHAVSTRGARLISLKQKEREALHRGGQSPPGYAGERVIVTRLLNRKSISMKTVIASDDNNQPTMSKKHIIRAMSAETGLSIQVCTRAYEAMLTCILDGVRSNGRVVVTGWGTFYSQRHEGHYTPLLPAGQRLGSYTTLKFSGSREAGKYLELNDRAAGYVKVPGTKAKRDPRK